MIIEAKGMESLLRTKEEHVKISHQTLTLHSYATEKKKKKFRWLLSDTCWCHFSPVATVCVLGETQPQQLRSSLSHTVFKRGNFQLVGQGRKQLAAQ